MRHLEDDVLLDVQGAQRAGMRAVWLNRTGSRRHLEHVLRDYAAHYNAERPHRSLELAAPAGSPQMRASPPSSEIRRRDVLGGLIHEYYAAAA